MRARIRLLLVLVAALPLLATTCVTSTRQRGPVGPWVGEVVNTGDLPMREVAVTARITDARGWTLDGFMVNTCPSLLMPGESAAFELFFPTDANLEVTPPLRAEFSPVAAGYPIDPNFPLPDDLTGDGLVARAVGTYPDKRAALVEVRNESTQTYSQLTVCATLRTPSGTLAEVGRSDLFPSVLSPGETATVPVFFNSMPDGVIDVIPRGSTICCIAPLSFGASEFEVQNTRVTTSGGERELVVTGEMQNRAGQDIGAVRLGAYASGSPVPRVIADLACGGTVRAGEVAAATFSIPIDGGASNPTPVITGIEARPSMQQYPLTVSNVASTPLAGQIGGLDTVSVTATLHNPSSMWIANARACAVMRDRSGHVVGVGPLPVPDANFFSWIAPGGSVTVTGSTVVLGEAMTATVVADGYPQEQGPIIVPVSQ